MCGVFEFPVKPGDGAQRMGLSNGAAEYGSIV
jgi:hypothetical protein